MSALNILGAVVLAVPFAVLGVVSAREIGLRDTLEVFGGSLGLAAVICLGAWMVTQ